MSPGLGVSGSPCLSMRAMGQVGSHGAKGLWCPQPHLNPPLLMPPLPTHLPSQCPGWASLQPWHMRAGVGEKVPASCQVSHVFLKLPSRK